MLTTTVVVVAFVDFVLRCRVSEDSAVGSWQGTKNPFRLPINDLFEGQLLDFEGRVALGGKRVALEGGERSDGEEEQQMHP